MKNMIFLNKRLLSIVFLNFIHFNTAAATALTVCSDKVSNSHAAIVKQLVAKEFFNSNTETETVIRGTHTIPANQVTQFRINTFLHTDTFYRQSDATTSIKNDGTFSIILPRSLNNADRAIVMLYPINSDPNENAKNCTKNICRGIIDAKYKVAFPVMLNSKTSFEDIHISSLKKLVLCRIEY